MEDWKKMMNKAVEYLDSAMDDKAMSDEIFNRVYKIVDSLKEIIEEE